MADPLKEAQAKIVELERELVQARAAKPAPPLDLPPGHTDHEDFKDGEYVFRATGEKFKLKKVSAADNRGRTHILKNAAHTHECTEKELREDFEKV